MPETGKPLNWQGWSPDTGMTEAEYFNAEEVGRRCDARCGECGFYYLDERGDPLTGENTPLCGVW